MFVRTDRWHLLGLSNHAFLPRRFRLRLANTTVPAVVSSARKSEEGHTGEARRPIDVVKRVPHRAGPLDWVAGAISIRTIYNKNSALEAKPSGVLILSTQLY